MDFLSVTSDASLTWTVHHWQLLDADATSYLERTLVLPATKKFNVGAIILAFQ
jgi:hypothetical protein